MNARRESRSSVALIATAVALVLSGCFSPKIPEIAKPVPDAPVPVAKNPDAPTRADAYADASDRAESKAAAAVQAAGKANDKNPDGKAKSAVASELKVAGAFLSPPTEADRREADSRVGRALQGDLNPKEIERLVGEASRLQNEREKAWEAYEREKGRASAAIEAARVANEERTKFLLALIGAGLVVVGVVLAALSSFLPFGRSIGGVVAVGGFALIATTFIIGSTYFVPVALGLAAIAIVPFVLVAWNFALRLIRKPAETNPPQSPQAEPVPDDAKV